MPRMSRTLSILAALTIVASNTYSEEYAFYHDFVMGTSLELRLTAGGEGDARHAEQRVLSEIDRLSRLLSGYDESSGLRRWQATLGVATEVAPELFEVLAAADRWRAASGGAFDPRAEIFSRLWADCAKHGRTPSAEERQQASRMMALDAWRLAPADRTATRLSACPLSLDGIAKGYIVERAADAGMIPGIRGLLLNVGGDLCVRGEPSRIVGIAPPRQESSAEPFAYLDVRNQSVATSGAAHRGFRIDGKWYSHIIDPRSGMPVERVIAATVVAPRGADADAIATALNVLPVDEGLRLVEGVPGAACLIVERDGRITRSAGWRAFERPRPALLASAEIQKKKDEGTTAASWGDTFELAIDFEINRPPAGKGPYRRPYVVIWAEDRDGHPIRTICLWVSLGGSGPERWLPDLARWYRDDPVRSLIEKKNMIFTIARPTRPPGKYSVVWDGKDDKGQPLPPGDYTIFIETAREHGTHELIRKPVTIANQPFAVELPGNVEIKSATLAYRRKSASR
jgi:thiamine biosynthesis lipoprotein